MYLAIYSKDTRTIIGDIKTYNYVSYTDQYCGRGSFEIKIPTTEESLDLLEFGNYIYFEDNVFGVIKGRKDSENTDYEVTIFGYLINHILEYRSFLVTAQYYDYIDNIAYEMLEDLFINPDDPKRKISYIQIEPLQSHIGDKIRVQNTGDTMFDVLRDILSPYNLGFELYADYTMTTLGSDLYRFVFRIIQPVYRTVGNTDNNDPVVFSFDLDNLTQLLYENDGREYRNIAIVAGEGEGEERTVVEVGDTSATGINRIELYVDARDIQSAVSEEWVENYVDEQFGELLNGEY